MKHKQRIIFVNRFFYPDISATSQVLGDIVFELVKTGRPITVITSRSCYADTRTSYPVSEHINGVDIIRVGKSRFKRTNYAGRLFDLMCFYFVLTVKLFKLVETPDILVCKTDPPLLIVIGALIKTFKKCRLISWNQDLFPEVAASYFNRYPLKLLYRVLQRARNASLKLCDQCIAISAAMKLKLGMLGVNRVHVISNWGKPIIADPDKIRMLKQSWHIEDKFIVEYSGNFGFAHEYETIKNSIELLKDNSNIVFLFIGSGRHYESLQRYVQDNQLQNVLFKPYQPAENLSESLSLADVHLVTFRPMMEGLVFPSKFYSICAAARPVLLIGDRSCELAGIIRAANCGRSFDIGQAQHIADYLVDSTESAELLSRQGHNARELFLQNYTLNHALEKWTRVLARVKARSL